MTLRRAPRARLRGEPGDRSRRARRPHLRQRERGRPRRRRDGDQAERRAYDELRPGVDGRRRPRERRGRRRRAPALVRHADASRPLPRASSGVGGIVHTHSPFATAWAQAVPRAPCLGTTHADHFHGPVPCHPPARRATRSRATTRRARATSSSRRSSSVGLEPLEMPAALVASHGPFAWGADAAAGGRERGRARGRRRDARCGTRAAPARARSRSETTCSSGTSCASTARRPTTARRGERAPPPRRRATSACTRSRQPSPGEGELLAPRDGGRPLRLATGTGSSRAASATPC